MKLQLSIKSTRRSKRNLQGLQDVRCMNTSDSKSVWQSFQRDTTLITGHSKKSTLD